LGALAWAGAYGAAANAVIDVAAPSSAVRREIVVSDMGPPTFFALLPRRLR
jgi:hypothetical protein